MALEVQHIIEKLGMHGAVCPVWEGPDQATFHSRSGSRVGIEPLVWCLTLSP